MTARWDPACQASIPLTWVAGSLPPTIHPLTLLTWFSFCRMDSHLAMLSLSRRALVRSSTEMKPVSSWCSWSVAGSPSSLASLCSPSMRAARRSR